jgi:hypothetical protein
VFAKWHLASERAPRASSVDEFGVEFDRDLIDRFLRGERIHPGTRKKLAQTVEELERSGQL